MFNINISSTRLSVLARNRAEDGEYLVVMAVCCIRDSIRKIFSAQHVCRINCLEYVQLFVITSRIYYARVIAYEIQYHNTGAVVPATANRTATDAFVLVRMGTCWVGIRWCNCSAYFLRRKSGLSILTLLTQITEYYYVLLCLLQADSSPLG